MRPASAEDRIDRVCDAFESAWREGNSPRLEDYLAWVEEPLRARLWVELLHSELECRRRRGEVPAREDYWQRFPDQQEQLDQILPATLPDPEGSEPVPLLPPLEVACQTGAYEVLEEIGRGGMGIVYRARQVALDRVVALKRILAGAHAGPQQRARFRTEALAAAKLQHPHIVQIHEVGEENGLPFLAMEYVAGPSLDQVLSHSHAQGSVGVLPDEAARLVEVLARAIHHAHQQGIIHRDLKPANVLLAACPVPAACGLALPSPDSAKPQAAEERGVPKITDFGLAKFLDRPGDLTPTGMLLGTPSYMAPEQVEGSTGQVGPWTDVWALGAILYELLTGRPPFRGTTVLQTVLQVGHTEPVRPTQVQPGVPRDLETICLKCLHKEPGRRYPTAEALAEDLRRFRAGEPILARPVTGLERAVKWARRRPAIASLLAAVLLLAVLGFGGITWKWQDEVWQRRRAEEAERQAQGWARAALATSQQEEKARQRAERALAFHAVALAQREWQAGNVARADQALEDCPPSLRFWEWRHLRSLCSGIHRTLPVEMDAAGSGAFSPDGRRYAVVSGAKVKVLEVDSGREVDSLPGVCGLSFSGDGNSLTTSDEDRLDIWDLRAPRRRVARLGGEGELLWHGTVDNLLRLSRYGVVTLSPDGRLLASASREGVAHVSGARGGLRRMTSELKVWEVVSRKVPRTLAGHTGAVLSLSFSPDGKHLASAATGRDGKPGEVKVWELSRGKPPREVATLPALSSIRRVAFSPDGKRLAVAGEEELRLWEWQSGAVLPLRGHLAPVTALAFSPADPSGLRLASGGEDRLVKVWDVGSGRELFTLRGHSGPVRAVCFRGSNRQLASASARELKVWDIRGPGGQRLAGHKGPVQCLAFSPDSKRLASGGADGKVLLWGRDRARGEWTVVRRLEPVRASKRVIAPFVDITSLAFSPDGKRLASASGGLSRRAQVDVWDLASGKLQVTLPVPKGGVIRVIFSPDGRRLVTSGGDGTVTLWEADRGRKVASFTAHKGPVRGLASHPDGTRLATSSQEFGKPGEVKVWDLASRREVFSQTTNQPWVNEVAFSPGGRMLAWPAGHRASVVRPVVTLWNLKSGEVRHTLRGHDGPVVTVAFHPREGRLASAGADGTVEVWDTEVGREVLTLRSPAPIHALTFSPDGVFLGAVGEDGLIEVWEAPAP